MTEDLKELAKLKIKLDLCKELYEKKIEVIKAKMKIGDIIKDPDGLLSIILSPNPRRKFNITGVKETFGEKAFICIIETVDAAKFDGLAKTKNKYIITEEQQHKCFTIDESNTTLRWDGLDAYRYCLKKN